MPKSPPLSPIARIFERDPQIASWTARLHQEAALTAVIRRIVPRPLAGRVRVAGALNRGHRTDGQAMPIEVESRRNAERAPRTERAFEPGRDTAGDYFAAALNVLM